jgi:uncharacterized membrane protein
MFFKRPTKRQVRLMLFELIAGVVSGVMVGIGFGWIFGLVAFCACAATGVFILCYTPKWRCEIPNYHSANKPPS